MALTKVQIDGVEFSDSTDLNVDSGTLVVDATNNRVGVGTASPGNPLEVVGAIETSGSSNAVLFAGSSSTPTIGAGIHKPADDSLAIVTGSTERARFDSSGRLLVGTSSDTQTSTLVLQGNSGASNDASVLRLCRGANNPSLDAVLGYLTWGDSGHTPSAWISGVRDTGTWTSGTSQPTRLVFSTTSDSASSPTERMRISANGNVNVDSGTFFVDAVNNRVGVGTTSPTTVSAGNTSLTLGPGSSGVQGSEIHMESHLHNGFQNGANISYIDSDFYIVNRESGPLRLYTSAEERVRIDSSGRLLVGTSSAVTGGTSQFSRIVALGNSAGATNPGVISVGIGTTPASGNYIGRVFFVDNAAGEYAEIAAQCDGTPGTGDYPGRLVFSTTADGASSPTERMRITNGGYSKFTDSGTFQSTTTTRHEFCQSAQSAFNLLLHTSNGSYNSEAFTVNVSRAATSLYSFVHLWSGGFADIEFNLRGDGNAYADGSWNGGGADYAEYFEWSDGNTTAEDRRGISVVLDGDKIREAVTGEEPIGVISGNPSVVGDAAWNKWNGKYLRDDFGTYIQEDYEVEDEDGNTVTQQRRKLNPDYDPDVEYVNREDRPEWDCVGLMGKLRIRKGQITGTRWIKMRDISDSVEEWLVR